MQQIAPVVYTKEQRPVPEDYRVPDYMEKIYTWCYVKPRNVKVLDRQLVVQASNRWLTWFAMSYSLARSFCNAVAPTASSLPRYRRNSVPRVLTTAAISCPSKWRPAIAKCRNILATEDASWKMPRRTIPRRTKPMTLRIWNVHNLMNRLSFLLLHEVPDDTKYKVINRIMMSVPVGGKAIFIEYHKPAWYR